MPWGGGAMTPAYSRRWVGRRTDGRDAPRPPFINDC
jgi:hypothetical protein